MRRKPYLYSLCAVYFWLLVTISGTWVFVMTFGGGDAMMFTLAMMAMATVGLGMLVLANRWDQARHAADLETCPTELITAIDDKARADRDADARDPVVVTLALCVAVTIAWQDKLIGIPFATSLVIIIGVFLMLFPIMERMFQPAQRSQ